MSVMVLLSSLCAFSIAFFLTRFVLKIKRREEKLERLRCGEILRYPRGLRSKLYYIRSSQLSQWIDCGDDLFIFRLVEKNATAPSKRHFPDELAVSHQQLGEILPWIPSGSRVVVYSPAGANSLLSLRLNAITLGRSIYVLRGALPRLPWSNNRMEGELCN